MGSFSIFHWLILLAMVIAPVALIGIVVWVVVRLSKKASTTPSTAAVLSTPTAPMASSESRLQELAALKAKGVISAEEYEQQRAVILRSI